MWFPASLSVSRQALCPDQGLRKSCARICPAPCNNGWDLLLFTGGANGGPAPAPHEGNSQQISLQIKHTHFKAERTCRAGDGPVAGQVGGYWPSACMRSRCQARHGAGQKMSHKPEPARVAGAEAIVFDHGVRQGVFWLRSTRFHNNQSLSDQN